MLQVKELTDLKDHEVEAIRKTNGNIKVSTCRAARKTTGALLPRLKCEVELFIFPERVEGEVLVKVAYIPVDGSSSYPTGELAHGFCKVKALPWAVAHVLHLTLQVALVRRFSPLQTMLLFRGFLAVLVGPGEAMSPTYQHLPPVRSAGKNFKGKYLPFLLLITLHVDGHGFCCKGDHVLAVRVPYEHHCGIKIQLSENLGSRSRRFRDIHFFHGLLLCSLPDHST